MPSRFEILDGAWPWGATDYRRSWLVVSLYRDDPSVVGCFPISTKDYRPPFYTLPEDHADFPATGLRETSHVYDERIINIPLIELPKRRGRLEGRLLASFLAYSGIPA